MSPESRQRVYEQLRIDEGVEYEIYLDHLGYATFGVGHLITDRDPENNREVGTKISEERVQTAFESDLDTAISECIALYGESTWNMDFPEEVQEILVNMIFNMGRTRLAKFKNFRAALENRDWKKAAVEGRDSLWHRQVTNRAERLMLRLEQVD